MTTQKANKKIFKGIVKSNKMQKTIVVQVDRYVLHPLYKKYMKKRKSFHVHDKNNICQVGDFVKIISCRPLSKMKKFRLFELIKKKNK